MQYCKICNKLTEHDSTREYAAVCVICGCVDEDNIYLSPDENICYQKRTSYKYKAHWNEHIKACICLDPPIPEDIYIFIRLAIYKYWLQKNKPPQTKRDIKKIFTSLEIPNCITEKYIKTRKFNVHRKYYERWRTILFEMNLRERHPMPQYILIKLTHLFDNFVKQFIGLRETIHRKSLFKFDFLVYFFLEHLKNINEITPLEHMLESIWFPIHKPINTKTLSEFKIVAHKCNLNINFNKYT